MVECKRAEEINHATAKHKAGVAILLSDKVGLNIRRISIERRIVTTITLSINQEDTIILNVHASRIEPATIVECTLFSSTHCMFAKKDHNFRVCSLTTMELN